MKQVGFFRRIFSLFYDSLIIAAIILVISLLIVFMNGESIDSNSFLSFIQFGIILLSGPIFYSYYWIRNNGQTIGMQAWNIRVISLSGGEITFQQSLVRCISSVISFSFLGLGYLAIIFNKNKMGWADKLSSTKIIKAS